jgi:HPt (histidine-containing phosphotransfer) domain-containing protein
MENFQEMLNEMGNDLALTFIGRAIEEAEETLAATATPGGRTELAEQAHQAIGSTGLTGLTTLSLSIRSLEQALRRNQEIEDHRNELSIALAKTKEAFRILEEHQSSPNPPK